ncbi:RNA polymerase recycling motor HelD [Lapidilactobacillus bayanensis]|uniref:RNA polymerase recycling motor HelD n=1 Tax=Lapidilactobacillus bayanensis TaxID=2485998 RepID=UPI000F7A3357|nr:RNA polymerase recycling motor HelD [Lapidilactobacillus bayanensis]
MFAATDQQYEAERVKKVAAIIRQQRTDTAEKLAAAERETHHIEQNYGDATKVNTTEIDDQMETNAAVQQQKQLVALAVENQTILHNKQNRLDRLQDSHYFGRIDIKEGQQEQDTLYIGTASLMNNDNEFLIYDWRSPIAGIYYNGTLGKVTYQTPLGQQQADLVRKRQFTIKTDQIVNMFDTSETIGDEVLQQVLGEEASLYMQNIVATIQREQNDIIRNTSADILVVQGVAGSGKTSAILQRVAYLLYHSRTQLDSDQIIMFSPNHLFSAYISQVLPSLGEKNMRQVTLHEFFSQRLEGLRVEDRFSRFETDQASFPESTKAIRRYLESAAIMQQIAQQMTSKRPKLFFNDLLLDGEIIITAELIQQVYAATNEQATLTEKILQTKNRLIRYLQHQVRALADSDWAAEQLDLLSDSAYHDLLAEHSFNSAAVEQAFLAKKIAQRHLYPIYEALYNNYFIDWERQYLAVLADVGPVDVSPAAWQARNQNVQAYFEKHQIQLCDVAPYLYLRDLVTGGGVNRQIQYLFIDEMQDYSAAELCYLQHAFSMAKLTLLGDNAQDLFAANYQTTNVIQTVQNLFPKKKIQIHELNNSYRSTIQITNFASALLTDHAQILAFNRPGPVPQLIVCPRLLDLNHQLSRECSRLIEKYGMIAILTKTHQEAEQIFATLQVDAQVTLMTEQQRRLHHGVMIMPIYLAKGLEFDAVIGYNVSETSFHEDGDHQILYTIASRAMHELLLLSLGKPSHLITDLPSNLYQQSSDLPVQKH